MNAAAYTQQLLALLPPGRAWPRDEGGEHELLAKALSEELARADGRVDVLVAEDDPRQTSEMLDEWEELLGLPSCAVPVNDNGRRAAIVARELEVGNPTAAHMVELAAAVGYAVTITYYSPFICTSECEDSLTQDAWSTAFKVSGTSVPTTDDLLECVVNANKPLTTTAVFNLT